MKRTVRECRLLRALPAAALLLAAACGSTTTESGIRIGDRTLDQFERGLTRESWLLAILGEPTSSAVVADEPEVRILRPTADAHLAKSPCEADFAVSCWLARAIRVNRCGFARPFFDGTGGVCRP